MNIQTILEFVLALASLIIIHEVGHFVACLILKIPVDEFGLGFPPPRSPSLRSVGSNSA